MNARQRRVQKRGNKRFIRNLLEGKVKFISGPISREHHPDLGKVLEENLMKELAL